MVQLLSVEAKIQAVSLSHFLGIGKQLNILEASIRMKPNWNR